MINNNIHFIFGFKEQTTEFLFCYFLSVYSAFLVNKPDKILFYYHFEPFGKWWDQLSTIPCIIFKKVNLPEYIGRKKLIKFAHKADYFRLKILYSEGGIYFDIDTISFRPFTHLLKYETVLGKEISADSHGDRICNAIMLSCRNSNFLKLWLANYETYFKPEGWGESSLFLPYKLARKYPNLVKIENPDVFFLPGWNETQKIFCEKRKIPDNLITLHLWETTSMKYMKQINDWEWGKINNHTIYGKIMVYLINKYNLNI